MLYSKYTAILLILAIAISSSCDDDEEATLPTWIELGLGEQRINEIKINSQNIYAATPNGMYRKIINPQDTVWTPAGLSGNEVTDFIILAQETLLASVALGPDNPTNTLYRSEDGGGSWQPLNSNFGGEENSITCQALASSPQQLNVLYGRGQYNVAKSTDGGQTWVSTLANWDNIGYQADLMYVDPNDPEIVWAGGETSIFSPYLFKSTDAGLNWMPMQIPANGDNAVYSLVTHPTDNQRVLVGMEGQIIRSEDGGSSWEVIYTPDNYSYFHDMQVSPASDSRVYATGTDGGTDLGEILLYVSNDFGQQWETISFEGKEDREYAALNLEVVLLDGQEVIFIGTNQGVFRYSS